MKLFILFFCILTTYQNKLYACDKETRYLLRRINASLEYERLCRVKFENDHMGISMCVDKLLMDFDSKLKPKGL